jgi:ADP-ribosyl-[dinitrogen reductase] hydrolase
MAPRTSASHPLRIDEVTLATGGRIGLTFCPGKQQDDALTGVWRRDLAPDLDRIADWGSVAVATLMEANELHALGVDGLGDAVEARGLEWHHLPIRDVDVPDDGFERAWVLSGLVLRRHLREGRRILLHCKGGLGRTGTIAARILVELGEVGAADAIARVRSARPGAIETDRQAAHVLAVAPVAPETDARLDRRLGCLLGGAVGDAFGYAVEFDRMPAIRQRFGPEGIRSPVFVDGRLIVSDDTQMTLFTLEGALRALATKDTSVDGVTKSVRIAYLDWLDTQAGGPPGRSLTGSLARTPVLRHPRAPGNTCLSALHAGGTGRPDRPINGSKGCGAVMRSAPLGFVATDVATGIRIGATTGALTHGHPEGWLSSAVMAGIVACLAGGADLRAATTLALATLADPAAALPPVPPPLLTVDLLRRVLDSLATDRGPTPDAAIMELGAGWVGEEALAIGLYAALVGVDARDVFAIASNHDGDSDSTASIAGQLLGAWKGTAAIPFGWMRRVDVLDPLLDLARRWTAA